MGDFDCFWPECSFCIPFCDCLHFLDRSLRLESDLSLSVDCSPGGAKFLVWKATSSHLVGTVITHENFLGLIFRNSFYALLCRRSVCTTLLNFSYSTFIRLVNCHSFTSCESACLFKELFFRLCIRYTVKRLSPPSLIFVYITAVSSGVVSPFFCARSLNFF